MTISYILAKLLQHLQIPQIHNSNIDNTSKVRFKSLVVGCNVGRYSYISENTTLLYSDVGAFCSIATDCFIGGASHPIGWVSSSPVFHKESSVLKKKFSRHLYNAYKRTTIGNDVWIGTHSLIKAGVCIGNGAVIAMGSVVIKNIGPYEIWGGNPAKLIRKRFDDETINKLMKSHWWEKTDEVIEKLAINFNNVTAFIEKMES